MPACSVTEDIHYALLKIYVNLSLNFLDIFGFQIWNIIDHANDSTALKRNLNDQMITISVRIKNDMTWV